MGQPQILYVGRSSRHNDGILPLLPVPPVLNLYVTDEYAHSVIATTSLTTARVFAVVSRNILTRLTRLKGNGWQITSEQKLDPETRLLLYKITDPAEIEKFTEQLETGIYVSKLPVRYSSREEIHLRYLLSEWEQEKRVSFKTFKQREEFFKG